MFLHSKIYYTREKMKKLQTLMMLAKSAMCCHNIKKTQKKDLTQENLETSEENGKPQNKTKGKHRIKYPLLCEYFNPDFGRILFSVI